MLFRGSVYKKLAESKYFKGYLTPKALVQLKRYLIAGISAFLVEYTSFRLFLDILGWQKFVSNSIAMFVGFWFSFLLNRYWSFESKDNFIKQLSLYGALFFVNLIISNFLMYMFSELLGIIPSISKVIIMGMAVLWNFVIFKKIIYRK